MIWAIVDENGVVQSTVESDVRPINGVKVPAGETAPVGWIWNGWEFDAPKWTAYEFLNRFTAEERSTLRAAAKTDDAVADLLLLVQAAQEVISNDPVTVSGMSYLVAGGLITDERKREILS